MSAALVLFLISQNSSARVLSRDTPPKDASERCEVVSAILGARFGTAQDRWYAPAIDQPCALKNGYRDGDVLVHATVQKELSERKLGPAFLRPLQRCGEIIVSMPPARLPRQLENLVNVVFVALVPDGTGGFTFYEYLQPVDTSDPYMRKGVIGTSCLPAWKGIAKRENKKWTARLIAKEPWVEPTSSGATERLRDLQARGIAPKVWPSPPAPGR
jgi:hypothetical protein